jgi:uncharacterized protein (TIGR00255 family)
MTGFGAGRARDGGEEVSAEVRSVNHKYCEVKPRLPRELLALEGEVVRRVKARLQRGSVEVSVQRTATAAPALSVRVDEALAREYAQALRRARDAAGIVGDVTMQDLAAAEGVLVLEERPPDLEAVGRALAAALDAALAQLEAMRTREGASLAEDLRGHGERLAERIAQAEALAPAVVAAHRERLARRVAELAQGVPVDPQRLAIEVAVFAERIDVAEEVSRLKIHLRSLLAQLDGEGAAVGRQLDFLVQEMHREVNTLGAKSQSAEVAARVVEMKALLERIREQVQNVE